MSTTPRHYPGKDVDAILALATITESAISNKTFLQQKRSTWADPFFENLRADIDHTLHNHLGIDSAKALRQATQVVVAMHGEAATLLAELKVQIAEDFKKDKARRDELLKELGFTDHLKGTQKRDQEALISLLYQFSNNMTSAMQAEITGKGTHPATINAIIGYTQRLKNNNVTQESLKGTKKEISAASINAFNDLYDRVMSVAKIAAKFFKDDPAKAGQFSFAKVKAALNSTGTAGSRKPSAA